MQIPSLCGHRGRCHGAVAENKQNSPHVFSAPSTRCPSALLTRRARRGCPLWGGMSLMGWDAPGGVRCPRHGGMPPVSCCPPVVPREIPVPHPARTPPAATSLRARHGTSQRARQAESFLLMKLRARTRAGEGLPERKKKSPQVEEQNGMGPGDSRGLCRGLLRATSPRASSRGGVGPAQGRSPAPSTGCTAPLGPSQLPTAAGGNFRWRDHSRERCTAESPRGRRRSLCFSAEVFGKGISQLPPWDLFALLNTHLT